MVPQQIIHLLWLIPSIFTVAFGQLESNGEESDHSEVYRRSPPDDEQRYINACQAECVIRFRASGVFTIKELQNLCTEACISEVRYNTGSSNSNGRRVDPEDFHRPSGSISSSNFNCELKCKTNKKDLFPALSGQERTKACKQFCKDA